MTYRLNLDDTTRIVFQESSQVRIDGVPELGDQSVTGTHIETGTLATKINFLHSCCRDFN